MQSYFAIGLTFILSFCSSLQAQGHAARTLDLDLILYGAEIIAEPGLTVPHPRYRQRAFVLEPLKSVAPELVDPETGQRIGDMTC